MARNVYKPRTRTLDAGRYSFSIHTHEDGAVSMDVVYVTPDGVIRSVLVADLAAEAPELETLIRVADPYDATNQMEVKA